MITIKINGKKTKVKVFDEFSVKQLKEWNDYVRQNDANEFKPVEYVIRILSISLGIPYNDAFNLKIKNPMNLAAILGSAKDYQKQPKKKILKIQNELYSVDLLAISTVGQRFVIEEYGSNFENEELLAFILAVAICGKDSIDSEKLFKTKDSIMDLPYLDMLPIGFFLYKNFTNGRRLGGFNLKKLATTTITLAKKIKRKLIG